ncbi:hypothetical protein Cni_G06170 [Canna indica]|uniref:RING-type domain-containing protein n=1 Tax=Canna indica TaxID=4628 RepID=A0AAQ3Q627_9LILI|nr:hypothetical protein Cni_G06170 [Canna indica]
MAVHAQYPYKVLSPDLARNTDLGNLQMMQDPGRCLLQVPASLGCFNGVAVAGAAAGKQQQILNNATVFSDPQSELTCNNVSGARKRPREESSMALPSSHHNPALATALFSGAGLAVAPVKPAGDSSISDVLTQSRLLDSATASTSGRLASSSSQAGVPLSRDLASLIYQQNLEIDAYLRFETERLRTGLEAARKRHCRGLLSSWEQQAAKRLMEKDAELESARRRNAELEEKLRQASEENQIWFGMAKNNEAVVCHLRASLEQVLLQNAAAGLGAGREGYGDSEGAPFPADDAQSCCFEMEDQAAPSRGRPRRACRLCGGKEVCMLLLPCKHLCLCKDCESVAGACPVCGEAKNACLQVFMC